MRIINRTGKEFARWNRAFTCGFRRDALVVIAGFFAATALHGVADSMSSVPPPSLSSDAASPAITKRLDALEKSVGEARGLRARDPVIRRLENLEARVEKLRQDIKEMDKRLRKVESRK